MYRPVALRPAPPWSLCILAAYGTPGIKQCWLLLLFAVLLYMLCYALHTSFKPHADMHDLLTLPTSSYVALMCSICCSNRCSSSALQPDRSPLQSAASRESLANALEHSLPAYIAYLPPACTDRDNHQQKIVNLRGHGVVGARFAFAGDSQLQLLHRLYAAVHSLNAPNMVQE